MAASWSSSAILHRSKPRTVKIDRGFLIDDNIIGTGCYATVYRVQYKGRDCTVKKIHPILYQGVKNAIVKEKFRDECALLGRLSHPNVVHFIGVSEEALLLTEWLPADLERVSTQFPAIPLSVKLSLLQDVSYGLLYLHSMKPDPIVHRDLTASNVLVTRDLRAKIADLGVARAIDMSPQKAAVLSICPGALAYMPPEALKEIPVYGTELDVFSFGHLCLYVANQKFPYVNVSVIPSSKDRRKYRVEQIKRHDSLEAMEKGPCKCLKELVVSCLSDFPANRPSAEKLSEELNDLCSLHPKRLSEVTRVCAILHKECQLEDSGPRSELHVEVLKNEQLTHELEQLKAELKEKCEVLEIKADIYKEDFENERRERVAAINRVGRLEEENKALQDEIAELKLQQLSHKKEHDTQAPQGLNEEKNEPRAITVSQFFLEDAEQQEKLTSRPYIPVPGPKKKKLRAITASQFFLEDSASNSEEENNDEVFVQGAGSGGQGRSSTGACATLTLQQAPDSSDGSPYDLKKIERHRTVVHRVEHISDDETPCITRSYTLPSLGSKPLEGLSELLDKFELRNEDGSLKGVNVSDTATCTSNGSSGTVMCGRDTSSILRK